MGMRDREKEYDREQEERRMYREALHGPESRVCQMRMLATAEVDDQSVGLLACTRTLENPKFSRKPQSAFDSLGRGEKT